MDTSQTPVSLCFIDTETTSLRPDRRVWEVAVILRRSGQADIEWSRFVDTDDLDLGNADLRSLRVGEFFGRHPQYRSGSGQRPGECERESDVLRQVEKLTRGAHLVGAMVSFDADVLGTRMRAHGIIPSWDYEVLDFKALAVGYLSGVGNPVPPLPWTSDELSRLIGVEPPGEGERHTALGDARWAARVWDEVMRGTP